jgi:hypothetical protein
VSLDSNVYIYKFDCIYIPRTLHNARVNPPGFMVIVCVVWRVTLVHRPGRPLGVYRVCVDVTSICVKI